MKFFILGISTLLISAQLSAADNPPVASALLDRELLNTRVKIEQFDVGEVNRIDVNQAEIALLTQMQKDKFLSTQTFCRAADQIFVQLLAYTEEEAQSGSRTAVDVKNAAIDIQVHRESEICSPYLNE